MKKTILLAFTLLLVLTLAVSCGKGNGKTTPTPTTPVPTTLPVTTPGGLPETEESRFLAFATAVSQSKPTKTVLLGTCSYPAEGDVPPLTLELSATLTVDYESVYPSCSRYEYEKEIPTPLGSGGETLSTTVRGILYSQNGHIKVEADGVTTPWTRYEETFASPRITLSYAALENVALDGTSLTATVKQAHHEDVFGTSFDGTAAVSLRVEDGKLSFAHVTVTLASGSSMEINAVYTYGTETVSPPVSQN